MRLLRVEIGLSEEFLGFAETKMAKADGTAGARTLNEAHRVARMRVRVGADMDDGQPASGPYFGVEQGEE